MVFNFATRLLYTISYTGYVFHGKEISVDSLSTNCKDLFSIDMDSSIFEEGKMYVSICWINFKERFERDKANIWLVNIWFGRDN